MTRRWSVAKLALGLLLEMQLSACGGATSSSLALNETLTVAMIGVFEAPADAVGSAEPKSVTFTVEGVTMTATDGTAIELFEGEPVDYKVVSRSQIIFEADLSEYVKHDFSSISVTFAPTIIGKGKYEDEMPATLTISSAVYADAFTVEKGKALSLDIAVQWKSTVSRDDEAKTEAFSSPAFVADLRAD